MQPLRATRATASDPHAGTPPRRDPAPSRLSYRFHRLWLTPLYRSLLRVGIPTFLILTAAGWYFANPTNRFAIAEKAAEIRRSIETRPEFMVKLMAIEGATPVVDAAIRELLPVEFPVSSFDLDLAAMQAEVAALDVIRSVDIHIRPGGVMQINVVERVPALVWRARDRLELIDATGHRVATVTDRVARPDLPLVAGQGANLRSAEALSLIRAAEPLGARLRGLVRVGERRWDMILDRGQAILLPETNPVSALDQVLALDQAQDLLARDITHIDMRNPGRPTLRLAEPAVAELRRIRSLTLE
ncbi:cell division protein FtsQ/DivIB [Maritimibacter sp. HL-12]|uniref:cell division protein FtsQ/DivIB n=1 Tax=Maritimibacter sp. HL-12 TaxID=1162418 RepID=UPI000A0F20CA|nr:cell division protein FtsQ [Maritimibacter sp. HL-12]